MVGGVQTFTVIKDRQRPGCNTLNGLKSRTQATRVNKYIWAVEIKRFFSVLRPRLTGGIQTTYWCSIIFVPQQYIERKKNTTLKIHIRSLSLFSFSPTPTLHSSVKATRIVLRPAETAKQQKKNYSYDGVHIIYQSINITASAYCTVIHMNLGATESILTTFRLKVKWKLFIDQIDMLYSLTLNSK